MAKTARSRGAGLFLLSLFFWDVRLKSAHPYRQRRLALHNPIAGWVGRRSAHHLGHSICMVLRVRVGRPFASISVRVPWTLRWRVCRGGNKLAFGHASLWWQSSMVFRNDEQCWIGCLEGQGSWIGLIVPLQAAP